MADCLARVRAKSRILDVTYCANVAAGTISITATTTGKGTLTARASFEGRSCGSASVKSDNNVAIAVINLSEKHVWSPGHGNLYDLELIFNEDRVISYCGLREVRTEGNRFLINGEPVFQRLVLDQGFYPTGVYTAPDAHDLERDIILSMQAGFNGARLHEKAFEPLFLYYCDKHGYIVWGEMGNWQLDISSNKSYAAFIPEWMEIVRRDCNHPSIVGWCPFNETWDLRDANSRMTCCARPISSPRPWIRLDLASTPAACSTSSLMCMTYMITSRIRLFFSAITSICPMEATPTCFHNGNDIPAMFHSSSVNTVASNGLRHKPTRMPGDMASRHEMKTNSSVDMTH